MAKPASEWLILKCTACGGMLKVSNGIQTDLLHCPHCSENVDLDRAEKLPAAAVDTSSVSTASHLPMSRAFEPEPVLNFSQDRATWEKGGHERIFDLKGKLRSSDDPDLRYDPDRPTMKRVNLRRKQREAELTSFDSDEGEIPARRSRVRHTSPKRQKQIMYLLIGIVSALGITVIVILAKNFGSLKIFGDAETAKPVSQSDSGPDLGIEAKKPVDDPLSVERDSMSTHFPAVRKAVMSFASAATLDKVVETVRDRERVEPAMRAWYTADRPWKPLQLRPLDSNNAMADGRFIAVAAETVNFETIHFAVEHTRSGFLLDWEAYTAWGEIPWEKITTLMPREPVLMRVVITLSQPGSHTLYYDGPYKEATHLCAEISDLDRTNLIYGYVDRTNKLATQLASAASKIPITPEGQARFRAIIRLKYPKDGTNPRQVEITEFLENGWAFRPDRSVD